MLTLVGPATLGLSSCARDENNFAYAQSVEIAISDEQTDIIQVQQGASLKLSPQVSGNATDYEYLWTAFRNNPFISYVQPIDTLSFDKDLDAVLDPAFFDISENYRIAFKATDKRSGVSAFHIYNIFVTNIFGPGLVLLEDFNGVGDLSMIMNSGILHQVYSSRHPNQPLRGPLGMSLTAFNITDDVVSPERKLYLYGENDGFNLDLISMQRRFGFSFLFFQAPSIVKPTLIQWPTSNVGVIVNEGLLSTNFTGGFPGDKKFGLYAQTPNGDYNYQMAPTVAAGVRHENRSATYPAVMYDQRGKKFYRVPTGGGNLTAFPTNASDLGIFDMNNVGLDMVKMEGSNIVNLQNVVMKEGQVPYFLQFSTMAPLNGSIITTLKQEANAPNLINATDKTISSSIYTPHMFYGHQQSLYRYAFISNTAQAVHTFASGEQITLVRFDKTTDNSRLFVATWNGTEGKLYTFSVDSGTGVLGSQIGDVYTGFGKIMELVIRTT